MSNMGTVEKIVEVLNNMCHDKKAQATSRYVEHSTWLSNEFSNIRNLIQPAASTVETTTASNSAGTRQKRKSPETCSAGSRNSPLHKRNSGADIDIAELLVAQNLPADLNKLKKEQLLENIHSRGGADMTMKALKKEMIEKLKELVIDIHRRSIPVIPEELSVQESSQQEDTEEVIKVEDIQIKEKQKDDENVIELKTDSSVRVLDETEAAINAVKPNSENVDLQADASAGGIQEVTVPGRKQSILSEYRQQVTASSTAVGRTSAAMKPTQKPANDVQSEFEARRLRHRMSQSGRPSTNSNGVQRVEQVSMEKENDDSKDTTELQKNEVAQPTPSEEELPLQSLMQAKPNSEPVNLTVEMETDHEEEDSNWNEVPSPKRGNSMENETTASNQDEVQPTADIGAVVTNLQKVTVQKPITSTTAEIKQEEVLKTEPKTMQEPVPTISLKPEVHTKPVSSSSSLSADGGSQSSAAVKKPTNVVGGNQLSFLGSSKSSAPAATTAAGKTKSVVPALAMAARQKEKEEARAVMKKKELEEKKKEHLRKMQLQQQQKAGSSRALGTNGKAVTASSSHHPTTSTSTKENKGFGWTLGGKSQATTASATHQSEKPSKENKPAVPMHQPSQSKATASTTASSGSSAVLTEKKIVASEYRQVTPAKAQQVNPSATSTAPSPPREEYKIDDDDDEDSDSGSGTDDEEEDKKKQIPDWAKGATLREALEKQYGFNGHTAVDPDQIFTEVQTCSLEEIFGRREGKCGKYSVRTSSAKWDEDEITLVEKRKYRNVMGYI